MHGELRPEPERAADGSAERFDPALVGPVVSLARRLQEREREGPTAEEIEAIAAEVGVDAAYVRAALEELAPRAVIVEAGPRRSARLWWAVAWTIPLLNVVYGLQVLQLEPAGALSLGGIGLLAYLLNGHLLARIPTGRPRRR